MKNFFSSKGAAWTAFILVLIYLVATFKSSVRIAWWAYADVFCIFMATFLNLVMSYIRKVNRIVAQKLNTWAFIFGMLFIVAFIAEWVAYFALT